MALITASTARSTAIEYNTTQLAATDDAKIKKYSWIFDRIGYAASQGLFECTISLTEQGYNEISAILINNGYTVIQLPVTTVTPTLGVALGSISSFSGALRSVASAAPGAVGGIGNPVKLRWSDTLATGGGI